MDIITIISLGLNAILAITLACIIPKAYNYCRKKCLPQMLSYKNDIFARDTIRYRLRDILHMLNNTYEETVVALSLKEPLDNSLLDKIKERPFSYSALMRATFCEPENLLNSLDKKDKETLHKFYAARKEECNTERATFGDLFSEQSFIDVEHLFYFYILNVFYGLQDNIKEIMSDKTQFDIYDPYKQKKKRAILTDLKKGFPAETNKAQSKECSGILKCLRLITDFENEIKGQAQKGIDNNLVYEILDTITFLSLESNTNDLSQLSDRMRHPIDGEHVYPNNLKDFSEYIRNLEEETTVNYLVDNCGVELFSDLTFAYILLRVSKINHVCLHINKLPVFVSDVIESDYDHMMKLVEEYINDEIKDSEKHDEYVNALNKIKVDVRQKEPNGNIRIPVNGTDKFIEIVPNFVWNMPTPYKEIKGKSSEVFSQKASILIIKGDLNYRRLVEDKNWPYDNRIEKLTSYIHCPTLVVRSIKSDLVLDFYGKGKSKYKKWERNDKYWKENGEYGVIRFIHT